MERTYDYSYLPCQLCVGKNHCARCGEEIRRSLLALPGVTGVEMDVPARRLRISADSGAFEDIEDRAEELGVFL